MSNGLVTIVMPYYDVPVKLVERAILSVIAQTSSEWRMIIVDDSSKKSLQKLETIAKEERIEYVRLSENGGVSAARNEGLRRVKTPFVMFLDADDALDAKAVQKLLDVQKNSEAEIVGFNFKMTTNRKLTSAERRFQSMQLTNRLVSGIDALRMLLSGKLRHLVYLYMYKTELFINISFPVGRAYGEDYSIVYKLFNAAKAVEIIPDRLYEYFQNQESVMHNPKESHAKDILDASNEIISFFRGTKVLTPEEEFLYWVYITPRLLNAYAIAYRNKNNQLIEEIGSLLSQVDVNKMTRMKKRDVLKLVVFKLKIFNILLDVEGKLHGR